LSDVNCTVVSNTSTGGNNMHLFVIISMLVVSSFSVLMLIDM